MTSAAKPVLLVEDDEDICASMAQLLCAEGYEVVCARDGQEALAKLQSSQDLPGVIVLDLMMPNMDGSEFRAAQQADPRLSAIPVLLTTAGGEIQTKAIEMGVQGYLRKPFKDLETILEAVGRFF
jgi:CheY-like chemotaxis protein